MMRGVLSALYSRFTNSLGATTFSRGCGGSPFIARVSEHQQYANFTSLTSAVLNSSCWPFHCTSRSSRSLLLEPAQVFSEQTRTVIKFGLNKGGRKSVKTVTKRFFRLHWGIWIRPIAGRNRRLWKKTEKQRNNYINHVFCNATQSRMLDKMVTKFWRKPKYYIEDPYEEYHKRENFRVTQKKPWRPEGVDYE